MVSRRKYFSILIMMVALLFMFQFSQIVKETGNDYDVNEYAKEKMSLATNQAVSAEKENPAVSGTGAYSDMTGEIDLADGQIDLDTVFFWGEEEGPLYDMLTQWCQYSKRSLITGTHEELASLIGENATSGKNTISGESVSSPKTYENLPGMLLIETDLIDFDKHFDTLEQLARQGVPIIFSGLPSPDVIADNDNLMELFGIARIVEEEVTIEGVQLFSDFLLGGEAVYKAQTDKELKQQDLDLTVPWYITGAGTKTYMEGLLNEDEVKREQFPRLLWRNAYKDTMVFVVNGNFLEGLTGIGILNAMIYEMQDYMVYPVVNAQCLTVADYPGLTQENVDEIQQIYSRSPQALFRDVVWPGLLSMSTKNNLKPTCYISTIYQYDEAGQPQTDQIPFYLQQMKEIGSEAGKSLNYTGATTLKEKISEDKKIYDSIDLDYEFGAVYTENLWELQPELLETEEGLRDIWTVTCLDTGEHPILGFYGNQVTLQGITNLGYKYTYSKDLLTRSLASGLGYSNILITLDNVIWPESKEDQWEVYFDHVYSNTSTYWTMYKCFEQTTASQSDVRIRNFLNLNYSSHKTDDVIRLNVSGSEEAWFVLRTHDQQITNITDAEYEKIEENAYLIHTKSNEVTIQLGDSEEVFKYQGPFGNERQ